MIRSSVPLVSVIVCAFNEERLIGACLQGLVGQSYPADRYELLIIDDESTDNTFNIVSDMIDMLKNSSRRMRLVRIRHGGLSVARNAGIRLSDGEIIAFIDGDAVPNSNWLEELVKPFSKGADYVGGRINLLNTDSWIARFLQQTRHHQFFGPSLFNDECIGCNMAFRRNIFEAIGGFHENFVSRGDESTLQERLRGYFKYAPAPNAVVLHERPTTVATAIHVSWKSATLSHLSAKASGKRLHWKDVFLAIEQFVMTVFGVLLCSVWFNPSLLLIPTFAATLPVIRRLYLRPLNRAIAGHLVNEYGLIRGITGHTIFYFLLNIIEFIGRAISPFIHLSVDIIPPMTTEMSILNSVESRTRMA